MTRAFDEFGEKTALRAKAKDCRASWTRPGLGYPLSSCSSAELDSVCPSVVILIDGDNLSIPGSVVFEHGVENDEQLAHASGENDFGHFAAAAGIALSQSLSKRSDVFVAAFGGEGGHGQGIPDGGASSPDGSSSHQRSAVVIERSDAPKGPLGTSRQRGLTTSPKRARTRASRGSVLARTPMPLAKSRT
jgi:hypothetical protein